jgi:hypothetical protein
MGTKSVEIGVQAAVLCSSPGQEGAHYEAPFVVSTAVPGGRRLKSVVESLSLAPSWVLPRTIRRNCPTWCAYPP